MTSITGISCAAFSAGAAFGAGVGLDPNLLLAQASPGAPPSAPASLAAEAAVVRHRDAILLISR